MSNPSKEKGTRAETLVKDVLKKHTKLNWQRTPLSGALNEKHGLKSDLYIPNEKNYFSVEVKHYATDHLTSALLTGKNPQMIEWWEQTLTSAKLTGKKPLLIYKHDRSKIFAAFEDMPTANYRYIFIDVCGHQFYTSLLEDYLIHENPKFI